MPCCRSSRARTVSACASFAERGLPDPDKLLRGSGNQTRSIHVDDASTLANPAIVRLIDEAVARAQAPFASKGKGPLVIKSISAKQRPRQPTT